MQEQAAAMEAVTAQAAPQTGAAAPAGAPQTFGVSALAKPASELSSEELRQLLGGAPNFREDPFGIRGTGGSPGNAFSPGAGNIPANQGAATDAYSSQTAQAGTGWAQTAEPIAAMGQATGGVQEASAAPSRITAKSIYEYLQSIGEINKNVDYDAAIDELAKAFAAERMRHMTDEDKRAYLVSHGIGNDIASIVIPEANAKAREKARQEAMAKMAANATNPMMAQAIALMSLTDGAKPGDFMDAIKSTRPEMGYKDTDLGGTTQQIVYDKNGWIKPEAAQLIKTLSPNEIVVSQDKAAGRQLRANIADAQNKKDLAVAGIRSKTSYDTARMQQENANWRTQYAQANANARAQYRSQNGVSGGSGKGEKLTQSQQHFLNEFSNRYLAAKQAISNGYGEDDHSLGELTDFLYDEGRKTLAPEEFSQFEAYVNALQGYMWKQHAIDDPTNEDAENNAATYWSRVPKEILEKEFGTGYNFDTY